MNDDNWLRLSLLQHFAYCPRQAQLLLDGVWEDNRLTIEGDQAHERVDSGVTDFRRGVVVHHNVELASDRLRVFGVADSIEVASSGALCPVEHKHGRGAGDLFPSTVHVVAQALCLEEMQGTRVPTAAIFVISERKRVDIDVDACRTDVEDQIIKARTTLFGSVQVFPRFSAQHCRSCSVRDACQPDVKWEER